MRLNDLFETRELWNDKIIVHEHNGYRFAVDDLEDPRYVSVWSDDNKKVGFLVSHNRRKIEGIGTFAQMDTAELDPSVRGQGLGKQMFLVMLSHLNPKFAGICGDQPTTYNKREIPAIWKSLGGQTYREDVIYVTRDNIMRESMNRNKSLPIDLTREIEFNGQINDVMSDLRAFERKLKNIPASPSSQKKIDDALNVLKGHLSGLEKQTLRNLKR